MCRAAVALNRSAVRHEHDLLVSAIVDMDGGARAASHAERVAAAMLLGIAGDVHMGEGGGALLATRALRQPSGGRKPRVIRTEWSSGDDGRFTLLAGTIHRREETCLRLGIANHGSPAQIYAAIHARYGERTDSLIAGNYVAIQWSPAARTLRIARAPMGHYPIHVWKHAGLVAVSSIPRVLFAVGAPIEIDCRMLADKLMHNNADHSRSWYVGHARVPAGTVEIHRPDGVEHRKFWSIDDLPPVRFARDQDYVEAVDEELGRAVDAALEDGARPAVWLSGGLDSQAVASYAVTRLPPGSTLPTFTSVPMRDYGHGNHADALVDESEHVRALAAIYPQIDPSFLPCEDGRFGEHIERQALLGSWPTSNETPGHWTHEGLQSAAALGCDTMLSGGFGNMSFSYDGQTGYPTWLRQGQWLHLIRELSLVGDRRSLIRRFASRSLAPNLPAPVRAALERPFKLNIDPFDAGCALTEDFARLSGALDRARDAVATSERVGDASIWRRQVWEDGMTDGPELQTAMYLLYGVQDRDPTAYQPLVELCAGIPDDQYLRGGVQRSLARRLLDGKVPDMVRLEQRRGFQNADWPVRFAKERAQLIAEIERLERDPDLAAMIDFGRLRRNLEEWGGESATSLRDALRIYVAVGMGVTAARFLRYMTGRNVG